MIGFYNYTVILTYLGFISGVTGIMFAAKGNVFAAIVCLLVSGLCDTFDGRVARTRERNEDEQRFGIQIDSLSDLVCFGVLPGMISYAAGMHTVFHVAIILFYVLAALIRLAYFNVLAERKDEESKGYRGLPVTSAALIFPLCYSLKLLTPHTVFVFTIVTLLTGIAFIANFKLKKPGTKAVFIMLGLGAAELALIFILLKLKGRI